MSLWSIYLVGFVSSIMVVWIRIVWEIDIFDCLFKPCRRSLTKQFSRRSTLKPFFNEKGAGAILNEPLFWLSDSSGGAVLEELCQIWSKWIWCKLRIQNIVSHWSDGYTKNELFINLLWLVDVSCHIKDKRTQSIARKLNFCENSD